MRVRLLGTGAAEGIPAWYSGSRVSEAARVLGGREVRTRCSALVDGVLKLDLGPDSFAQMRRDGLDARDWLALIFTHTHDDHFALDEIQYGLPPFNQESYLGYTIYGNEAICHRLAERYPDWPIELVQTRSFESYSLAEYTITPVSAYHMEHEDAQNILIQRDGRTFLYGTDTGIWRESTWEFLASYRLDALVLECTAGQLEADYWGHLGLTSFLQVVERLRTSGILKPEARVVSTHHSHQGEMTYAELSEALTPHSVKAGYDGYEFEV